MQETLNTAVPQEPEELDLGLCAMPVTLFLCRKTPSLCLPAGTAIVRQCW